MTEKASALTMYVYYKIPTHERSHYLTVLTALNEAVTARYPHLKTKHQKRPELDSEQRELWMETYGGIQSNEMEKFSADLAILSKQVGLPSERKYEIFVELEEPHANN